VEGQEAGPVLASRRRRPWAVIGVAFVALILTAGTVFLTNVYMPLEEGSSVGPDQSVAGSLFERSIDDPFGSGSMWLYCGRPNGRFAWYITLRNTGPLPVTVLGGDSGPIPIPVMEQGNSFWLVDLAAGRLSTPTDTPIEMHGFTNPRTAPVLSPTVIAPGRELEVWARYAIGGLVVDNAGGRSYQRSLRVRYSILGIERIVDVPLHDGVAIESPPCSASATGG
jgi:hypothetical protein